MNVKTASIENYGAPFYCVILYLMLEFGRPQAIIPGLNSLHLPAVVTVFLLIYLFRHGNISFSEPQTKFFLSLIVLMFFHIFFAVNNYWAFNTWRTMVFSFSVYLCIILFVDSREKYYKLIDVWVYIHLFLAIFGIMKGGRGIGGFLADENDFCMTLNMAIPFSFFLSMGEKSNSRKLLYIVITIILVFTNMLTFSRGGFVGLLGVGIYIWIKSTRKMVVTFLILFISLIMFFVAPAKYGDEIRSITKEGTRSGTGGERTYLWGVAWQVFKGNPIFGVGQGNAPWEFRTYEIEE